MSAPPADRLHAHAGIAGLCYLAIFLLAPWVFGTGKATALVPGDAAASTANVLRLADAFRAGIAIEWAIVTIELVLAAVLFAMFRPHAPTLAIVVAITRAGEALVQGVNLVTSDLVLRLARDADVYAAFDTTQREALVLLGLEANHTLVLVWGLFFGVHLVALAAAAWRSRTVPRVIAALLVVAGAGYLAQGLGTMVWPPAAAPLAVAVVVMAVPGELAFTVWLLRTGWRHRRARFPRRAEAARAARQSASVVPGGRNVGVARPSVSS